MTRTVLILGASYAGLTVAHRLLKHTLPVVADFKVVLVNPSTHFFWNLASIRSIIPGQITDDEIFQDISHGFKYASNAFELIVGATESIDVEGKVVSILTANGERQEAYDFLIVVTGSRTVGKVPWKSTGTYNEMLKDLQETRNRVEKAKSIIVAGGGATGVELAGELGFEYGDKKDIKLVIAGNVAMEGSLPLNVSQFAEDELEKLNIKIIRNNKIENMDTDSDGQTNLVLENGQKLTADLFLPTFGLVPNSGFLPKNFLNTKGEVIVDECFRVKGVMAIWAVGDVADIQRNAFVNTLPQAQHLAKSLDLVLKGMEPLPYKIPTRDMIAVCLGRSKGTGINGSWRLPSLGVWFFKGRTLGLERMDGLVTGSGA